MRGIADAMVSSGLRDAGYVYFNLDGGWQDRVGGRDGTTGRPIPSPHRFPSGQ